MSHGEQTVAKASDQTAISNQRERAVIEHSLKGKGTMDRSLIGPATQSRAIS